MTISGIQSTDGMRSFVEANPNKLANRSYLRYQVENKEKTKKLNKKISVAVNSLPVVAAVSAFALTKNPRVAAKSGAVWGAAVLAPWLVNKANKAAVKANPDIRKTEKKHSGLTLLGIFGASYAAIEGGIMGVNKLAKNATVSRVFNSAVDGAKGVINTVKDNVKVPKRLSNAYEGAVNFVKKNTPKALKDFAKSEGVTDLVAAGKKYGKTAVANAPFLVGLAALGAIVGKSISNSHQYVKIKSDVKNEQFETAKDLVNAYADENDQLKAENEDLKAQLASNDNNVAEEKAEEIAEEQSEDSDE